MKMSDIKKVSVLALSLLILGSCAQEASTSTGWTYNKTENGGFEKKDYDGQETGPGLVFIEGGKFTMGTTEDDVFDDWSAPVSSKHVESFYMDKHEVCNLHWLEYVYWMKRVYYKSYPHIFKKSLPDTLVWRSPLSYRESYVENYFRSPAYRDYPVVGVSWIQANDFCKWRTDRVNEAILVREGIINWHFAEGQDLAAATDKDYKNKFRSAPENMFNTDSYLSGQYNQTTTDGYTVTKDMKGDYKDKITKQEVPRDPYMLDNYDPVYAVKDDPTNPKSSVFRGKRQVRLEDGILLPKYRLPIEAEWEFAANGLIGNLDENSSNINDRRIYPWDGHYVRKDEEQFQGDIQANFVKGKADFMGIAGALNDGAGATCRVDEYWPNDYGLYNMAGNVSEWVLDTYRPLSSEVTDEFMPFRGNVYQTKLLVPDGLYDKQVKASENIYDVYGMKEFVNEYARVKYLEMANIPLDLNSKFQTNYTLQQNSLLRKSLDFTASSQVLLTGETVTLSSDTSLSNKSKLPINWSIINAEFVDGTSKSDTTVKIVFKTAGTYTIRLSQGSLTEDKMNFITVVNTADELKSFVNTTSSQSKIISNQSKRKYQFNSPSNSFLSNNSRFTLNDSIQFAVLDDINALLDTAIYLFNKGNTIKASAYIEKALFGNQTTSVTPRDFRNNYTTEKAEADELWNAIGVLSLSDDDEKTPIITSIFNDLYLNYRFKDYKTDPTISAWLIVLRNDLSEFVVESRGKQRWRNVTEDENINRLNYRKDDYIDYLDGDLESSIFYNNTQRKNDINTGKRDGSQVVYQSEYENYDLQGVKLNDGVNGWPNTLISDRSKVYKGGSWNDRAYWLASFNRRFLDEDKSSAMIGFRCAMDRVGDSRQDDTRKKRK